MGEDGEEGELPQKEDLFPESEESPIESDSLDEEEEDNNQRRARRAKPFFTYDELRKPKVSRLKSILKKTNKAKEKKNVDVSNTEANNYTYEPPHNSLKPILKKKTTDKTKGKKNVHLSISEAPKDNSNCEPHYSLAKKHLAILNIPKRKEKHVEFISKIIANHQIKEDLCPQSTLKANVSTCLFPEQDHRPQSNATNFKSYVNYYPTAYPSPYYYPYSNPQLQPIYRYPHILQL